MVAPKAETIFSMRHAVIGIVLSCPECPPILGTPLRVETIADYEFRPFPAPNLVTNPGPLGFVARCNVCGFRVEMHGDRLPTLAMLSAEHGQDDTAANRGSRPDPVD